MPLIIVFRPHQSPAWAASFADKRELVEDFLDDQFDVHGLNAACDQGTFDRIKATADIDRQCEIATEVIGHDLHSLTQLETAEECARYIAERDYAGSHNKGLNAVTACARELGWIAEPEYRIAFAKADGSWDVVETFRAADNDAANEFAEDNYDDQEWYVLDASGRNINGGRG